MPRDLASIVNCLFCDSYFLFTVHEIDLKDFRRKQGKAVLLDLYEVCNRVLPAAFACDCAHISCHFCLCEYV